MTTIKSLRAKQKEDEKTVNTALSRADRAEKALQETKLQLRKAQEIEKKNTERLKSMYKIEASNEALRRDKDAALATIAGLQIAVQEAEDRAEEAMGRAQTEALEQERVANVELREKLGSLSTEYSLAEESYFSELTDLKARLEREQLSAKTTQSELQTEISVFSLGVTVELMGVDFGVKVGDFEISRGRIFYVGYVFCTDKVVETD